MGIPVLRKASAGNELMRLDQDGSAKPRIAGSITFAYQDDMEDFFDAITVTTNTSRKKVLIGSGTSLVQGATTPLGLATFNPGTTSATAAIWAYSYQFTQWLLAGTQLDLDFGFSFTNFGSTGNTQTCRLGLINVNGVTAPGTAANLTGIYLECLPNGTTNSCPCQLMVKKFADSAPAAVGSQYFPSAGINNFRIVNDGTNIKAYFNNNLMATLLTSDYASLNLVWFCGTMKTLGTTASQGIFNVDYVDLIHTVAAARK